MPNIKMRISPESTGKLFTRKCQLERENEQLRARVARLELEEEGAKEAFGVIADENESLRGRNKDLEKTIHRQIGELQKLYRREVISD